jgi:hypothetical protein
VPFDDLPLLAKILVAVVGPPVVTINGVPVSLGGSCTVTGALTEIHGSARVIIETIRSQLQGMPTNENGHPNKVGLF